LVTEEFKKINSVCAKAVFEIQDSLRYLSRKDMKNEKSQEVIQVFNGECDSLLFDVVQLEQYVQLCNTQLRSLMLRNDIIVGAHSSLWYIC
jgi:hypothetical protein